MSVGDAIAGGLGDAVNNTVCRTLEALDGWLLLVGINIELDEQEQVAGQDTTSKQGGRLGASAVSNVRPVQALCGIAGVGCKSPSGTLKVNVFVK